GSGVTQREPEHRGQAAMIRAVVLGDRSGSHLTGRAGCIGSHLNSPVCVDIPNALWLVPVPERVTAPNLRLRHHRVAVVLTSRVTSDLRLLRILTMGAGTGRRFGRPPNPLPGRTSKDPATQRLPCISR